MYAAVFRAVMLDTVLIAIDRWLGIHRGGQEDHGPLTKAVLGFIYCFEP